jgi:zinc/manganese transport system substrate-binding protein
MLVCTGAELEIGWVPLLLSQSGNPNIQVGRPGNFEAAAQVRLIEIPTRVDRSMGDVHPAGNPHLHLHPANIAKVATALADRMSQLDARESAFYREREKAFQDRWQQARTRWEKEGAPLKGVGVITYHKDFSYLLNWLGMRELGNLEPKPGLPPTTAHLSEVLARLAKDPAKTVLRAGYQDPRPGEWLSEHAKIPVTALPYTVGGSDKAKDLVSLYDDTLARLLALTK